MANVHPHYKPKTHKKSSENIVKKPLDHNKLGLHGEIFVLERLLEAGYKAQICRNLAFSGDCLATCIQTGELHHVEVKTAQKSSNGGYRFCMFKNGHTDCKNSDFAILICIDDYGTHYLYVIPCALILSNYITISSHPTVYKGKYSTFRIYGNINFAETREVAELWLQ